MLLVCECVCVERWGLGSVGEWFTTLFTQTSLFYFPNMFALAVPIFF